MISHKLLHVVEIDAVQIRQSSTYVQLYQVLLHHFLRDHNHIEGAMPKLDFHP